MKYVFGNIFAFILFNLIGAYLTWNILWFTELGGYESIERLFLGFAIFIWHLPANVIIYGVNKY